MWPKGKTINDATMIGKQDQGMYMLNGKPKEALVHDSIEPNELWHKRLAHVHYYTKMPSPSCYEIYIPLSAPIPQSFP